MMVTDMERPLLPQLASRGVLSIVPDNPVNFLQAVWMPRPRSMLTVTHCLCYIPFFSVRLLHTQHLLFLVAGLHLVWW